MMDVLINPALPQPETTLPRRKMDREGAAAVMKRPVERSILEKIT
jgi:hypothetical protein